ncbi:MAG: hypothetical protein Tsb0020_52300 [Haliangiales bacterium]
MLSKQTLARRQIMERLFLATVSRLNPSERTTQILAEADWKPKKTVIVAVGKAALSMCSGSVIHLTMNGHALAGGVIIVPRATAGAAAFGLDSDDGVEDATPRDLTGDELTAPFDVEGASGEADADVAFPQVLPGGQPHPDESSLIAAQRALDVVAGAPPDAEILVLLSGGASSLMALPAPGLTLADKNAVVGAIIASGADRRTVNMVRKHLSAIKGGRLAAAARVPMATLVASDVVGDDLTAVGSGPTLPNQTSVREVCDIIASTVGWSRLPWRVRAYLDASLAGEVPEMPSLIRPGDRVALVAGTGALVEAGLEAADEQGFTPRVFERDILDDVETVASRVAAQARRLAVAGTQSRLCFVGGGEPSLSLPANPGVGGRAQHLALSIAREIVGVGGVTVLVAASDGIDGNTEAAGAVVDGNTWDSLLNAGVDPAQALASFDTGRALDTIGATLLTGASEIKHGDLIMIATGV